MKFTYVTRRQVPELVSADIQFPQYRKHRFGGGDYVVESRTIITYHAGPGENGAPTVRETSITRHYSWRNDTSKWELETELETFGGGGDEDWTMCTGDHACTQAEFHEWATLASEALAKSTNGEWKGDESF